MATINGKPVVNKNNPATKLSDDELLYRAVEQLCVIADMAKALSEIYVKKPGAVSELSDDEVKKLGELIGNIHQGTRGLDTNSILSRMVVNIAAVTKSKNLLGATLTVSKVDRMINLKTHYANGPDDYYILRIAREVAQQLRDGLTQGINMIEPEPQFVMPDKKLIT